MNKSELSACKRIRHFLNEVNFLGNNLPCSANIGIFFTFSELPVFQNLFDVDSSDCFFQHLTIVFSTEILFYMQSSCNRKMILWISQMKKDIIYCRFAGHLLIVS